jgi:hypothetical protein
MFYVPCLKAKKGEVAALANLKNLTKAKVQPILQIPPPDLARNGAPTEATVDYAQKVGRNLAAVQKAEGPLLRYFLDPSPAHFSPEVLSALLEEVRGHSVQPWPLVPLRGGESFLDRYRATLGEPERLALRITSDDAVELTVADNVAAAIQHYGFLLSQVVLIIDVGSIVEVNVAMYARSLSSTMMQLAPLGLESVVLLSSAFPKTLDEADKWEPTFFPRREVELWQATQRLSPIQLQFGDYATSYPSVEPGIGFQGSPKVRYTTADNYLVIKGAAVGRSPNTMAEQFHRISYTLASNGNYMGRSFSWGDAHIHECCDASSESNGNLTTWVKVNTNHHIEEVVFRLLAS